jgi:hypothetical protein
LNANFGKANIEGCWQSPILEASAAAGRDAAILAVKAKILVTDPSCPILGIIGGLEAKIAAALPSTRERGIPIRESNTPDHWSFVAED